MSRLLPHKYVRDNDLHLLKSNKERYIVLVSVDQFNVRAIQAIEKKLRQETTASPRKNRDRNLIIM